MTTLDPAVVVLALAASRKYRHVAPDALERVAAEACRGARHHLDAVKRAKRKLHQVFAAFITDLELARAEKLLAALPAAATAEVARGTARALLGLHASTRERLATLDRFHAQLFEITGPPRRVLDLGCGFHPFTLPWMGLAPEVEYVACDLDRRTLALVQRFLSASGQHHRTLSADLVAAPPKVHADVAFLMKLLPPLERQAPGAAARLLEGVSARHLIITFPAASLGGRGKAMAGNYAAFMQELLAPRRTLGWKLTELPNRDEVVYLVEKPLAPGATEDGSAHD